VSYLPSSIGRLEQLTGSAAVSEVDTAVFLFSGVMVRDKYFQ